MAAGGEKRIKEISDQYNLYAKANPAMTANSVFFSPESWNTKHTYPVKSTK